MQLWQFQPITWCFDKNLEQVSQKNPQNLPKDGYMNNSLGIYSTSLILSEFWHLYWNSSTPWFEQSLCSLIGTFKRYCLIQNAFSTLKVLSWNLSPICVSFYRIRKIVVFFLEARSNSKIPLIKTKCVVIYHGKKNGGNNGYCRQRFM